MRTINFICLYALLVFTVSCHNNTQEDNHIHEESHTHDHYTEDSHFDHQDAAQTLSDTTPGQSHSTQTGQHINNNDHHINGAEENEKSMHGTVPHSSTKLSEQEFSFVLETSGQIMVDMKDEIIITSPASGIVKFSDHLLYTGLKLNAGETLFTISGEGLTSDNPTLEFRKSETEYETAKLNYERASSLIKDKLITEKHYLDARKEYLIALEKYNIYRQSAGKNNLIIPSPASCFLKNVYVKEGQNVGEGDALASVLVKHNMVLRADIAPSDFHLVGQLSGAKFKAAYIDSIYSTSKMSGRLISYGKSTGENSYYIPVYFRLDYKDELIPGTFVDIWLTGNKIKDAIVIPNTSLLEEYGKFYVFVDHGDHFDKRYITTGQTDGELTHVISGLEEGEEIVTEGVWQVKLSLMNSVPSSHNHNH